MSAEELPAQSAAAMLSPGGSQARQPRRAAGLRPPEFDAAFDSRTLFYDCFWHVDGRRVLLVGPPPLNLAAAHRAARYTAQPGGTRLRARRFASLSTMVTALSEVPAGTSRIDIDIAGQTFGLPVQPNSSRELAGRRVLFSINRNNDLAWIREWATCHAALHGTDAVILVDNGSTRYAADEVLATLREVSGLAFVAVPRWPQNFGPFDPAVKLNPYWARFLQIGSMSMVLRRYGEAAYGLLDCDIDELAGTKSGRSIYELARQSRGGLVVFRGTWIEAAGEGARHRDFTQRLADPEAARSPQRKWVLDPSRPWVRRLSVHPYWHWIEGRPLFSKSMPEDAQYWHFKGINTNWKQARTQRPVGPTEIDPLLAATLRRLTA